MVRSQPGMYRGTHQLGWSRRRATCSQNKLGSLEGDGASARGMVRLLMGLMRLLMGLVRLLMGLVRLLMGFVRREHAPGRVGFRTRGDKPEFRMPGSGPASARG
jgi:hypothetical protein